MAAGQWWVVPMSTAQQIAYDATHSITSQGYPGYVKQSVTKPTPGSFGPYATQADAQAKLDALSQQQHNAQTTNVKVPGLTGLTAVGDFFSRLTQANTWVRAGQVVLGLILLAVGVARITNAVPIATKIAKTAGMAAAA